MIVKKLIIIFLSSLVILSCNSQNCISLPTNFSSYNEAISLVKSSSFKLKETANTSNSSWITSAQYYSCDGITGYFIYTTRNHKYIHQGVPLTVWRGFKNADSKGSYYDHYIRYKYQLNLK